MIKILQNILAAVARRIIKKFQPDIIGITGSAGKTSAKEAIFSILSNSRPLAAIPGKWGVRRNYGNLNNELGLSLSIIANWKKEVLSLVSRSQPAKTKRLRKLVFWIDAIMTGMAKILFGKKSDYPKALILEYGADRPGDIKKLMKIAKPKIGVITAIGQTPVHVEFYDDIEEVAREKFRIVESLPVNGWAVLNFDDETVMEAKEKTKAQVMTFGFNEGADVKIFNLENRSEEISLGGSVDYKPEGTFFKIQYQSNVIPVTVKNVFGKAQAYAVASAFAVGIIYGLHLVEIAELIERHYIPEKRRMNVLQGIKESWIIDDSYNASPLSMAGALDTLKDLKAVRKVAVLGDMLELGKYSVEAHENIGKVAGSVADILMTVGPRAKFIAAAAKESGMADGSIFSFDTAEDALQAVQALVKKGDLILVKASRGIGLDKVVDEIKKI